LSIPTHPKRGKTKKTNKREIQNLIQIPPVFLQRLIQHSNHPFEEKPPKRNSASNWHPKKNILKKRRPHFLPPQSARTCEGVGGD
jgi:hypothetical protein